MFRHRILFVPAIALLLTTTGCEESSSPTDPERPAPAIDNGGMIEPICSTARRFTEVVHNSTCAGRSDGTFLCDLEILLENNCESWVQNVSAKWSLTEEGEETRLFRSEGICWAGESPGVAHVEYTARSVAPGQQRRIDGCLAFENLAPGRYTLWRSWQGCTELTSRSSCYGASTAPAGVDGVATFEIEVGAP